MTNAVDDESSSARSEKYENHGGPPNFFVFLRVRTGSRMTAHHAMSDDDDDADDEQRFGEPIGSAALR